METTPKLRGVRQRPEQAARSAGSKKEQGGISTTRITADGFLKCQFLPLYEPGSKVPLAKGVELPFFACLYSLAQEYGFEPMDVTGNPFPYNVLLAHGDAQTQLRRSGQDIDIEIIQDSKDRLHLAVNHTCQMGSRLFYVPVIPLYKLMQDKQQQQTAGLLLSVFSYLYHIAQVPDYRHEDSELYGYYQWVTEDLEMIDKEEAQKISAQLEEAAFCGDAVMEAIYGLNNLNHFGQRIAEFKPSTTLQGACWGVAKKAYALLEEYPEQSLFRNMYNQDFDDNDMYEGVLRAEQYISFIAEGNGELFRQINQMVNDCFGNYGEVQMPAVTNIFDGYSTNKAQGLDFEHRFFELLEDLCTLLNSLP